MSRPSSESRIPIRTRRRSSIWQRYLLTYLLVFILPFAVLTGVLFKTNIVDIRHSLLENGQARLAEVQNNLELRFTELERVAHRVELDPDLLPGRMSGDEISVLRGINKLQVFQSTSAAIQEMRIYYRERDEVFAQTGRSTLDYLLGYTIDPSASDTIPSLASAIRNAAAPAFQILDARGQRQINYLVPIHPLPDGTVMAVVIYTLDQRWLEKEFITAQFDALLYGLYTQTGAPLWIWSVQSDAAEQLQAEAEALIGQDVVTERDNIVFLQAQPSPGKHFVSVAAVAAASLYRPVNQQWVSLAVLFILLLATGASIVFIVASRNYRPIQNLVGLFHDSESTPAAEPGQDFRQDELDLLHNRITSQRDENRSLRTRIADQQPLLREHLLTLLISGRPIPEQDWQTAALFTPQQRAHGWFTVLLIIGEELASVTENTIREIETHLHSPDRQAYWTGTPSGLPAIILVSAEFNALSSVALDPVLRQIASQIEQEHGLRWQFTAGLIRSGVHEIRRSYYEAITVAESGQMQDSDILFRFDELRTRSSDSHDSVSADRSRLLQALRHGDFRIARESLDGFLRVLEQMAGDPIAKRYILYDLVNLLIRETEHLDLPDATELYTRIRGFQITRDLEENALQLLWQACARIRAELGEEQKNLRQSVLEYLDSRLSDPALSLESCADQFQMPYYSFSRMFKEQFGSTFINWVTDRRASLACDLLRDTDLPVREIAGQVGYLDASSFTRMFKKTVGISPIQFREQSG